MHAQDIPLVSLNTQPQDKVQTFSNTILENEIEGVRVEHVATTTTDGLVDSTDDGIRVIYLFVKGTGIIIAENKHFDIVPETIFLPNAVDNITIKHTNSESLHYLKISCTLSAQDLIDLQALPSTNTQHVYHAKFIDCESYSEAIKSSNTVSRTILSNEYIPRIAMGTVQTKGPDKVAAHQHPMLEQLFLGLSENRCIVYADDQQVDFPPYSVLHIPLGSNHSVSVEKEKIMYYVWMDFFLDRNGEEWLKTHKVDSERK